MPSNTTMPLNIKRSHPCLTWLTRRVQLSTKVPEKVARELAQLRTMDQAQAFVRTAGLDVLSEIRRESNTVNSVSVAPPEGLVEDEYYALQIVLPKVNYELFPFGSLLMNCLLPPISDKEKAIEVFQAYQAIIQRFCKKLEALPFACISGIKYEGQENLPHDLYLRGFRFFFSPNPAPLFTRISSMIEIYLSLEENYNHNISSPNLAREFQELKFCKVGDKDMRHSILEDVMTYPLDTVLVDLRENTHSIPPKREAERLLKKAEQIDRSLAKGLTDKLRTEIENWIPQVEGTQKDYLEIIKDGPYAELSVYEELAEYYQRFLGKLERPKASFFENYPYNDLLWVCIDIQTNYEVYTRDWPDGRAEDLVNWLEYILAGNLQKEFPKHDPDLIERLQESCDRALAILNKHLK